MGSSDVKLQYIDDDPESYSNIFNQAKTDITEADQNRLIKSLEALGTGEDIETVVNIDQVLRGAVKLANFTVYDQAAQFEDFTGMGTTLAAALISGKNVSVVNVGDSRVYAITAGGIRQLTRDHSLVQMMVERGELTPELARTYPGKNFITRAIGTDTVVECDLFHTTLDRGDFLLLCSDGLSNMMDDQEILFEVVHGVNKQQCCQRLLDIAKNRGAPDNVTSILIQV